MSSYGLEWINLYNGTFTDLYNCEANVDGFETAIGTAHAFKRGNNAARDSHFEFTGSDNTYVDKVDLTYFSGHGSTAGARFYSATVPLDDAVAKPSEMHIGDASKVKEGRWIVFDACDVLRYPGSATSLSAKWKSTFVGLHYILGFHDTSQDSPDRGRVFAEYLADNVPVHLAWRMACEETEVLSGSSGHWAYLRAFTTGASPVDTSNETWPPPSARPYPNPQLAYVKRTA